MPPFHETLCWCLFLVLSTVSPARAAVYRVGSDRPLRTISSVPSLKPGDVVEIQPGVYRGYRKWTESGTSSRPITLRGVGSPRPIIDGMGLNVSGVGPVPRALFQIDGSHYLIENLEFRNARNGQNGAGIRVNGATGTTIRNCRITRCEMGIMSGGNDRLTVEKCEIAYNGNPEHFNGYAHNLYLGGNRTTVRFCWIHDAIAGMNFKSRGHYTELLYNWIADSNEGEISLVDGEDTRAKDSNAVLIGNVIVSKPDRTGNHEKFIDWGQDMGGARNGTLYLIHNTLVAGSPQIAFLSASASGAPVEATNNLFYGSETMVSVDRGAISGSNNWAPENAILPNGFKRTLQGTEPKFINTRQRDYRLAAGSPCRGAGLPDPGYRDSGGAAHDGRPQYQMDSPLHVSARHASGLPDIGALGAVDRPNAHPTARGKAP